MLTQRVRQHRLAHAPTPELISEIVRTEENLLRNEAELAASIAQASPLGLILRLQSEQLELKSYLKGLKFLSRTTEIQGANPPFTPNPAIRFKR